MDRTLVCLMEMVPEKASGALGVLVNYGEILPVLGTVEWRPVVYWRGKPIHQNSPIQTLSLTQGGVATNGDTHRFYRRMGFVTVISSIQRRVAGETCAPYSDRYCAKLHFGWYAGHFRHAARGGG